MEKIQKYNCTNYCCEKNCDKLPIWFHETKLNGMKLLLTFCDKHKEKYDEVSKNFFKPVKEED